jgi:hypothetical protein
MVIQSNIPFQPTTMSEIEAELQRSYPNSTADYKERRDAKGVLRVTLRTYTNALHHFQIRHIIGNGLSCREVPVS